MLFFILLVCNFHTNICQRKAPEISAFINGLIQFDQMYPKKKRQFRTMTFQEVACLVTVFGVTGSMSVFPFGAIFGLHWIYPWKFSLAGYWLIPKSDPLTDSFLIRIVAVGIKILILVYNCWVWNFVIFGAGFVVGLLHNLCVNTILGSLEL